MFLVSFALLLTAIAPVSKTQAAQLQTQIVNVNNRTLPKNAVRVPFIQVSLRAIGGPVEINSLTVVRTGLSTNEDFGRVWAQTDNFRRTNGRQLNNDDQVVLEFRSPLVVNPGTNERLTVYANLEFEGGGRTAALNLTNIESNASDEPTPPAAPMVEVRQTPVITQSQSRHNRQQFKIRCKNQICQLVPRN